MKRYLPCDFRRENFIIAPFRYTKIDNGIHISVLFTLTVNFISTRSIFVNIVKLFFLLLERRYLRVISTSQDRVHDVGPHFKANPLKSAIAGLGRTRAYTCAPFTQGIPHLPLFVFTPSAYLEWSTILNREDITKNRAKEPTKGPETSFVEGSRSRCDTDSESRHRAQNLVQDRGRPAWTCSVHVVRSCALLFGRRKRRRGRSMWTGEVACHLFTYEFLHLSVG